MSESDLLLRCPSCGREGKTGPNAAKTFTGNNKQEWCEKCAAIKKNSEGMKYVDPTGPGKMMKISANDPLAALHDCYDMKPKKRILVDDAKSEVLRAWDRWKGEDLSGAQRLIFFGWLRKHRPYFLTFQKRGVDYWQRVNGWLTIHEGTGMKSAGKLRD